MRLHFKRIECAEEAGKLDLDRENIRSMSCEVTGGNPRVKISLSAPPCCYMVSFFLSFYYLKKVNIYFILAFIITSYLLEYILLYSWYHIQVIPRQQILFHAGIFIFKYC